jgi:hypothetical protein
MPSRRRNPCLRLRLRLAALALPPLLLASSHVSLASSHVSLASSHVSLASSHVSLASSHVSLASSHALLASSHALLAPRHVSLASSHVSLTIIHEHGSLAIHGKGSSSTIDEHGRGWGSFHCGVAIQLTLSGVHVTGRYTAYRKGGSITGVAHATIHSATSSAAHFTGTIQLHGGTGRYSHSSGRASFDGSINRKTYAMSVYISGRVRL